MGICAKWFKEGSSYEPTFIFDEQEQKKKHVCFCVNSQSAQNISWSFTTGHMLMGCFLGLWIIRYEGFKELALIYLGIRYVFFGIFNIFICQNMLQESVDDKTRFNYMIAFVSIVVESIICMLLVTICHHSWDGSISKVYMIFLNIYHAILLIIYAYFTKAAYSSKYDPDFKT